MPVSGYARENLLASPNAIFQGVTATDDVLLFENKVYGDHVVSGIASAFSPGDVTKAR